MDDQNHISIFTDIYETCAWGDNINPEYKGSSGNGSSITYNYPYIKFLREFIKDKGIRSVVDLGCGDFRCGKVIYDDLPVKYTGYDAYDKVIAFNQTRFEESATKYTFIHQDFCHNQDLQKADLCIIKDVLQHWSNEEIYAFMDKLIASRLYSYILICNCKPCANDLKNKKEDIITGDWRPLAVNEFPLLKYNLKVVFQYYTKQVCLLEQ
jgi:hypothetical protein